tara:strand:+ start:25592 stop:25936 length:345 start_codon:yes stop_codon:yes gene_type:complete
MVKIVDYKTMSRENGESFHALVVQGGLESVRSKETNRNYFTVRQTTVPCTFDEDTCKSLIGSELEGSVVRVEVEPYEYVNEDTGQALMLSHRYEYLTEDNRIVHNNVIEKEEVL